MISFTLFTENFTKIVLDIEDNGLGILKDQPYLFDPFFTTKDHGTGLKYCSSNYLDHHEYLDL